MRRVGALSLSLYCESTRSRAVELENVEVVGHWVALKGRKEKEKKEDFLTVATDVQLNKMQNGGKSKRALGDQVSNILYLQGSVDMKWEKHI